MSSFCVVSSQICDSSLCEVLTDTFGTFAFCVSQPQADREYFEQKNRFKKAEQMERRRLDIERDQQRHERQKQEMLANRCGPAGWAWLDLRAKSLFACTPWLSACAL